MDGDWQAVLALAFICLVLAPATMFATYFSLEMADALGTWVRERLKK